MAMRRCFHAALNSTPMPWHGLLISLFAFVVLETHVMQLYTASTSWADFDSNAPMETSAPCEDPVADSHTVRSCRNSMTNCASPAALAEHALAFDQLPDSEMDYMVYLPHQQQLLLSSNKSAHSHGATSSEPTTSGHCEPWQPCASPAERSNSECSGGQSSYYSDHWRPTPVQKIGNWLTCDITWASDYGSDGPSLPCVGYSDESHQTLVKNHFERVGAFDIFVLVPFASGEIYGACYQLAGPTDSPCLDLGLRNTTQDAVDQIPWLELRSHLVGTRGATSFYERMSLPGSKTHSLGEKVQVHNHCCLHDLPLLALRLAHFLGLCMSRQVCLEVAIVGTTSCRLQPLRWKKVRDTGVLYNPRTLNDCFFACIARQALGRVPDKREALRVRSLLSHAWAAQPALLLETATSEGMTPNEYRARLRCDFWGGLPETTLLLKTFGLNIEVISDPSSASSHPSWCSLMLRDKHFTLCHLSKQDQWRDIAVLIRRRDAQLGRSLARLLPRSPDKGGINRDSACADSATQYAPEVTRNHDAQQRGGMNCFGTDSVEWRRFCIPDLPCALQSDMATAPLDKCVLTGTDQRYNLARLDTVDWFAAEEDPSPRISHRPVNWFATLESLSVNEDSISKVHGSKPSDVEGTGRK
eukprot:612327-Amphidinium_carterae.1